jgi:hypothetical protein
MHPVLTSGTILAIVFAVVYFKAFKEWFGNDVMTYLLSLIAAAFGFAIGATAAVLWHYAMKGW